MKAAALVLLAAGLAGGCVSRQFGASGRTSWEPQPGVTMTRDVVGVWGNPDSIDGNVWTWKNSWTLGGKVRASYNVLGVTIYNLERATRRVRLEFDQEGRLVSVQKSNTIPEGVKWHLSPWW